MLLYKPDQFSQQRHTQFNVRFPLPFAFWRIFNDLELGMVERLFLAVPRDCLRFVIVVFPDHNHYFEKKMFKNTIRVSKRLIQFLKTYCSQRLSADDRQNIIVIKSAMASVVVCQTGDCKIYPSNAVTRTLKKLRTSKRDY